MSNNDLKPQSSTEPSAAPKIRWDVAAVLFGTLTVAVTAVPWYGMAHGFEPLLWLGFSLFVIWNGMSITAGYHRLWSHKSYEAHFLVRLGFALGGALSIQNSIKVWTSNHRTHHRHTDDVEQDPYSARKGLWYSHIGWMLRDYPASKTDFANVKDLEKDPIVAWQHKYYWPLVIAMNVGLPLALGAMVGDAIGGLLLMGFLRLVICHHTTFFINSLAHFWGRQPYSDRNSAKDNALIALLTYGEGYHNYHHTFQWDYRNGIRWYHFDPSKWLIATLAKCRLASNLKVAAPELIEKSLAAMQHKLATAKLQSLQSRNAEKWLELLDDEYEHLVTKINEWSQVRQRWLELRRADLRRRWDETDLANKLHEIEHELNLQRQQWRMLTQQFA
jgi:stearoyl-CoA desaturase (delta-9 desaturase)